MKMRLLFGGLFLAVSIAAIGFCVNAKAKSDNFVAGKIDSVQREIKKGVWIYFSTSYFPGDDIMKNGEEQDLTRPYVEKKLSEKEVLLLDSVLKGLKEPPANGERRAAKGCFSPRHAVVYYDSTGMPYQWVNICFACGNVVYYPNWFGKCSLDAWEIFFKRVGFPARDGYDAFFDKAKTNSVYRKKTGTFHF